jgi:hypothetical protein
MNQIYTLLFLLISLTSQAQDGVFLTAEDFIENKAFRPENSKIQERLATVSLKIRVPKPYTLLKMPSGIN